MKKFLLLLVLLPAAAGAVWYESKPTTVKIPVETADEVVIPTYEDPVIIEDTTTTTAPVHPDQGADFSKVNVHLEIKGVNGDDVTLEEMVHQQQHLDHLPSDVRDVVMSCPGVTDRDMVVRIDTRLHLNSSMPADVHVDYGTVGYQAVFNFKDGLSCQDDGSVVHHLTPGNENVMSYWVILNGIITPDAPDGGHDKSWYLTGPLLTLPNLELMHWKLWGSNVAKCNGLLGETTRIELAGIVPAALDGCQPAYAEAQAAGNM